MPETLALFAGSRSSVSGSNDGKSGSLSDALTWRLFEERRRSQPGSVADNTGKEDALLLRSRMLRMNRRTRTGKTRKSICECAHKGRGMSDCAAARIEESPKESKLTFRTNRFSIALVSSSL